ncbi:mitochondrial import inner membrane translocase subunit TIM16 [Reticulomyxa filosa]|uniref:Mitochondrial import inner membrane translocase subunit TIM16 n=1 Tax=Reticulomyxa filosa TaxID=46433 RepID=X6N261_RETFI|nr:mitochondrial import inner membrane translocase subunit TIM16 [Reticulomyxa filosa]|eukprot:ETO20181.1 mitochondrial import inner membrane translocase subunit TIM16 [Reticulomyxa filosa]
MAIWARVLAQVVLQFGNVFVRAFGQALEQAGRGGGKEAAQQATRKVMGKMSHKEALKILNIEEAQLTHAEITKRFEKLYQLNQIKQGGSYFLQCKAEHAKNTLNEYLSEELQKKEQSQNSNNSSNNSSSQDQQPPIQPYQEREFPGQEFPKEKQNK